MVSNGRRSGLRRALCGAAGILWVIAAHPAIAQAPPVADARPAAPSDNAMVNLVRLLVAQGVITADKGDALIHQAEAEAAQARAAAPAQQQAQADLPPPAPGTIRVPYVPETVRAQIKNELRTEVLAQAKSEGWAAPGLQLPDWVRNVTPFGDVRVRSQSNFYARTNSNLVPDFAAINANGATDLVNGRIPFLNTTVDRKNLLRFRARLGVEAALGPKVQLGIELATGDTSSPVSTNALLGGGLSKRDIWLQLAYLRAEPTSWSKVEVGRFANPFYSTDLLFDADLAFDGLAVEADVGKWLDRGFDLAVRGGAFPLGFGDQNFPATQTTKSSVPQKYLFSAQVEAGVKLPHDVDLRLAAAYHNYVNLQGKLSSPCLLYAGQQECSTDGRRPFFLQKGNTLGPLRQIAADPTLGAGQVQPQPQLLGLAFDYNILDVAGAVTVPVRGEVMARLSGDYVRNLAFHRSDVCRNGVLGQPFNNGGSGGNGNICDPVAANRTPFVGGNQGYQVSASLGHDRPRNWGEWRVYGGYRYLQSDAVLDAFTDDNFHLGGTNAKGYFVGGETGIYRGLTLGARWLSANEVSGEPLAIDVLQIDLQAAF